MNNIFRFIYNVLIAIMITLLGPILIWIAFSRFDKVGMLIDYGRLGIFAGNIRIETNTDNVLWQGKSHEVPKSILSMHVYNFWAEGDVIVVKVYRNDKKISKIIKEDSYV